MKTPVHVVLTRGGQVVGVYTKDRKASRVRETLDREGIFCRIVPCNLNQSTKEFNIEEDDDD